MTISHTKSSPDFRGPVPFQRERQRQRHVRPVVEVQRSLSFEPAPYYAPPRVFEVASSLSPELAVLLALRRDFATLASGFQYSGETAKRPVRREQTRTPKISEKKAFKTLFPSVLLFGGFTNQSMNSNQIKIHNRSNQ